MKQKTGRSRSTPTDSSHSEETFPPLAVEQVPIDQLKPNPQNPRLNDEAVDAVARSIQTYGFNNPIICDGDLDIAAGHTRLKAARQLGLKTVPVIRVPGLVGSKFTGFAIADNATGAIAQWDLDLLNELVSGLNLEIDFDLASLGFDDAELTRILDWDCGDEDERADEAPPLPEEPTTRPGDLWLLGDHRVLCGDATSGDDVSNLMGGKLADMIFTDPPYGVSYDTDTRPSGKPKRSLGKVTNDDLDDEQFVALLKASIRQASTATTRESVFYICFGGKKFHLLQPVLMDARMHISSRIVWVKNQFVLGRADYHTQWEFIIYGWKQGSEHEFFGGRAQSDVWDERQETHGTYLHPTMKPVRLCGRAIKNSSRPENIVLDPFGGSGSTLIACEQLDRHCYMMELDPRYCDVIVNRWETYTGMKAELVCEASRPVEEVTIPDGQGQIAEERERKTQAGI